MPGMHIACPLMETHITGIMTLTILMILTTLQCHDIATSIQKTHRKHPAGDRIQGLLRVPSRFMVPMGPPVKVRTESKTKRKVQLGRIYQQTRSKKPSMVYVRTWLTETRRERRRGRERKLSNCQVTRARQAAPGRRENLLHK
jgi:type IV secretory pathway VirB10-like protein